MAREDLHFRLRLPGELKQQIEESAAANRRSMTAEIVARLMESFGGDEIGRTIIKLPDELISRMALSWGIGFDEPNRTATTVETLMGFLANEFPVETLDIFHYRLMSEIDATDEDEQKQKLIDAANKYAEKKWPNIIFGLSTPADGKRRLVMESRQR